MSATVALSKRHGLSQMFLGLTVLAIGTDLPELIVAIDGAFLQLRGVDAAGVVVGNSVGSAIAQGGLVLGIACLAGSFDFSKTRVRWDGLVLLFAIGLLALLAADGMVNRAEGAALSVAYGIYLASLLRGAKAREGYKGSWAREEALDCLKIAGAILVVLLSAEIVLQHAIELSHAWNMSQTVVGALIVGVGTSLPELALSLGAAFKGQSDLSIGNLIGSNIFDVLVPVGMSALLYPLPVERESLVFDLPFLAFLSGIVLIWASLGKRLGRLHAGILIGSYLLYAGFRLSW